MALYLAVDAGGTKALYALADETRELARVRGGSIKRMRVDAATADANLAAALKELEAAAGVSLKDVTRTCVGTAGESVALVADWLREEFGARVGGELVLVGDVEIALDAAFCGEPGVLVLAGTGSNVAARQRDGSVISAGGWGPLLGDEGSGYRIASEGLRAVFRAIDAGRETMLLGRVLEFWGLKDISELVAKVHAGPDFPPLAQLVVECAAAGDEVSREVLQTQGEALGQVVLRLLRRADLGERVRVAFAGSIVEHVMPVREAMERVVRAEFAGVEFRVGVVDPIDGALWRARLS